MFYQVKLKYQQVQESGMKKTVTEEIVCDALTFAEAEAIGIGEMEGLNGVDVTHIKRLPKLMEVFNDHDGEAIYKVVVYQIFVDEKTGKEYKLKYEWLMWANSVDHATRKANEIIKQGYTDMFLGSVRTTTLSQIILPKYYVFAPKGASGGNG